MILSTNFRNLKKSLLGFIKYPSQVESMLTSGNMHHCQCSKLTRLHRVFKQRRVGVMFWKLHDFGRLKSRLDFHIPKATVELAFHSGNLNSEQSSKPTQLSGEVHSRRVGCFLWKFVRQFQLLL